jgi:DNA-binding NtrC family response regulator
MSEMEIVLKRHNENGAMTEQGERLAAGSRPLENPGRDPFSLRRLRAEAEIHAISQALEETGWNRKKAARLLSISYRGLLYKIRQHNITRAMGTQQPCLTEER